MRKENPDIAKWVIALCAAGALTVSIWTAFAVNTVHVSINSRMSELLELTKASSKAEGVKQELDRVKEIPH